MTIKGLSDSTMVSESKVAGHLPSNDKEIIISAILANRLELELGDKLSIYIVENRESVKPRTIDSVDFTTQACWNTTRNLCLSLLNYFRTLALQELKR